MVGAQHGFGGIAQNFDQANQKAWETFMRAVSSAGGAVVTALAGSA